jgi:hypothetical protein
LALGKLVRHLLGIQQLPILGPFNGWLGNAFQRFATDDQRLILDDFEALRLLLTIEFGRNEDLLSELRSY